MIRNFYARSVDFDYNPIGRCTEHKNSSISCWTQVNEAAFDVSLGVSSFAYRFLIKLTVYRTLRKLQALFCILDELISTIWTWLSSMNQEKRLPPSSMSTTEALNGRWVALRAKPFIRLQGIWKSFYPCTTRTYLEISFSGLCTSCSSFLY